LYRTNGQGQALYPDLETLFGSPKADDPILDSLDSITAGLSPEATIYAPLGVGYHVDHLLVRDAVLRWRQPRPEVAVFFYEEYPYSADRIDAVEAARAALGISTQTVVHRLSNAALDAKIKAIACYESQISTFWDGVPAMADAIRRYTAQVGQGNFAERFWQP
jgi:LmbE family N-acetylglucosaminyl deacetylase